MIFLNLLNNYLNINSYSPIGYTEQEIARIEKLYNINCNGSFKELLLFSGRSDGGFFGNDNGFILYNTWSIYEHIKYQIFFRDILYDSNNYTYYNNKPFVFSVIDGVMYYFLNTANNDDKVYSFFDETGEVLQTNFTLDEYLLIRAKELNAPCSTIHNFCLGELINLDA